MIGSENEIDTVLWVLMGCTVGKSIHPIVVLPKITKGAVMTMKNYSYEDEAFQQGVKEGFLMCGLEFRSAIDGISATAPDDTFKKVADMGDQEFFEFLGEIADRVIGENQL